MRKYTEMPPKSRKVPKGVKVKTSWCTCCNYLDVRQKHSNDVAVKEMKAVVA